jgi:hypothetical protein
MLVIAGYPDSEKNLRSRNRAGSEVAQFLIDIAQMLEYGDSLEDLFPILMDDENFSDDSFENFWD